MSIGCPDCRAGLEHCHGAVIHHSRYRTECTQDACHTPEAVHAFSLDCAAIGCRCGQAAALAM